MTISVVTLINSPRIYLFSFNISLMHAVFFLELYNNRTCTFVVSKMRLIIFDSLRVSVLDFESFWQELQRNPWTSYASQFKGLVQFFYLHHIVKRCNLVPRASFRCKRKVKKRNFKNYSGNEVGEPFN